jgi:uroporphyrinogen-III synthase
MSEARPLGGVRIAVTRPADPVGGLSSRLEALGAIPLAFPLVRIVPPADERPLREAAAAVASYDWVVFTSANAVRAFLAAMAPTDLSSLRSRRIGAVGPATAVALAMAGVNADAVPATSVGAAVAAAMSERQDLRGVRVLWPRAGNASEALANALHAAGALTHVVEAYRTEAIPANADALIAALRDGNVDILTFTSPSAVASFTRAGGAVPEDVRVAVIGPVTREAVTAAGFPVHIEAPNASAEELARAIVAAMRDTA